MAAALVLPCAAIIAGYTVDVSHDLVANGKLSAATIATASSLLDTHGVVVLKGGVVTSPGLTEKALLLARRDLTLTHARLEKVGIDPMSESFSFAEIVHRSRLRYDMSIDVRRMPEDAPWEALSAATRAVATPIIERLCEESCVECAAEGLITSLPGAVAQRFHIDGEGAGSFNAIVPLVDTGVQGGTGTEFWLGSHRDPVVAQLIADEKLSVDDAAQLPVPADRIVKPALTVGDCVVYDYRVVHRGPANGGPSDRPVFYSAWADVRSSGDGYNFPRRSLAELERRSELFGPLFSLRGGGAGGAGVAYIAGDVVALFHAFSLHAPTGSAAAAAGAPPRGFFRTLPCDDDRVYIGPSLVEASAEPNCFLAPSEDGGQTRRLLAFAPIAAGERLSVPFASDMERLTALMDEAVSRAAASAADTQGEAGEEGVHNFPPPLGCTAGRVCDVGDGKGRGVFATRRYEAGDLVASWPCRAVPDADVPSGLIDYAYTSPRPGESLIVLGHGMLYNHGEGDASNVAWSVPTDMELLLTGAGEIQFFARRPVNAGDELLASYSTEYWESRGLTPL